MCRPAAGDGARLDLASTETVSLQEAWLTSPHGPRLDSSWLVHGGPTSPPRDLANSRLSTATETKQRRWARMRAQACAFEDLPKDLYSLIVPHVECAALGFLGEYRGCQGGVATGQGGYIRKDMSVNTRLT